MKVGVIKWKRMYADTNLHIYFSEPFEKSDTYQATLPDNNS